MNAVIYARVSKEEQDQGDSVSISQQIELCRALCARNDWQIFDEFVDNQNYIAQKKPKKGTKVNPSGERDDRPGLLAMLDVAKTGQADVIIAWRDDRLVRHPRVNVAIEDALDTGDSNRKGKPKIQIVDATGAVLDRFTMSIKAAIWKEENKRRVERYTLGKIGTLKAGFWPGTYRRLGYDTIKRSRGNEIVLSKNRAETETVKFIFNCYDSGKSIVQIREMLIKQGVKQKETHAVVKHLWSFPILNKILRCRDYTGTATWKFGDGTSYTIKIPQIISPEQYERVQQRMDANKRLSTRNAKTVYLLQGLAYCGDCGAKATGVERRYYHRKMADGTTKKYYKKNPHSSRHYRCCIRCQNKDLDHPSPYCWKVVEIDNAVWEFTVKNIIEKPDVIAQQIAAKQVRLQAEGDSVDGEIARAYKELQDLDAQRAFYQRQAAKGFIKEPEFEQRMAETEESQKYWQDEIERLKELRDNATKVKAGLDYVYWLLSDFRSKLAEINQSQAELDSLSFSEQQTILYKRREMVRVLCDKVYIHADGRIRIEGAISGESVVQSDSSNQRLA